MKQELLRALDTIIADLRDATAAIQRDDYDTALEHLARANDRIRQAGQELAPA